MNEDKETLAEKKGVDRLSRAELVYFAARGILDARPGEGAGREPPRELPADTGPELLLQAAEMGVVAAKREAGALLVAGLLFEESDNDREKGLALLRDAVMDGDEEAEVELARALHSPDRPKDAEVLWQGATVLWRERADYPCAHHMMSRAARMGHVPAMRDLAQMIREGVGCDKDPHLAAEIEWQADELSKK